MKKLFTSFVMLAAMLCSTTAWADAGLKVCGINVNLDATSTQTVTGSGISGSVTYDPSNKRLILKNATLTSSGSNDGIYCYGMSSLEIARTPLRRQPCGGRHNTKGHCHPRASSAKTRGFHTQLDEGPETP